MLSYNQRIRLQIWLTQFLLSLLIGFMCGIVGWEIASGMSIPQQSKLWIGYVVFAISTALIFVIVRRGEAFDTANKLEELERHES